MKVLMLGWEYPPHISGGLGTACEGLTKALSRQGVEIDFVVPHLFGGESAPHMKLLDPSVVKGKVEVPRKEVSEWVLDNIHGPDANVPESLLVPGAKVLSRNAAGGIESVSIPTGDAKLQMIRVPSYLTPYLKTLPKRRSQKELLDAAKAGSLSDEDYLLLQIGHLEELLPPVVRALLPSTLSGDSGAEHYHGDLFGEVGRYTARVLGLLKNRPHYDMIHAHDWMTYPAAVALKALTGLPIVLHVHSLEFDRSGENGNWQIEQIERAGLEAADQIIAVSYYTRSLIHQRHGIPLEKIGVVHNGVYTRKALQSYQNESPWPSKIVLFLGRVTFQKGPDYFVEAAAKVIPHVPDVLFVMAGSGDMLPRMVERVNELGIGNNFLFTGFLKGQEVEKMFSMAHLYVMPSVSEPFGISALEAISFNTPVIISKQSGVSEVLSHALKVNFWDVDQLANLMISVLKYPELGQDISLMASEEVRRLRWDASASRTVEIYAETLARLGT